MDIIRHFEETQTKSTERPLLRAGDLVRVETKIEEGGKTRLQTFEGMILAVRGSGPSTTFTVRRETGGFGVERIFPLHSPLITSIDIVKRQKVRRAKLTYLRQAGRRRFKEDVEAMQRHLKEEGDKKRLAAIQEAQVEEAELKKKKAEEAEAKAAEEAKNVDKEDIKAEVKEESTDEDNDKAKEKKDDK